MLTVLFATRNGSRTLGTALEKFAQLRAPLSGWKLVIVDNGSTDYTPQVIASFQASLPLTYVFEGTAGKNFALNAGLAHLEGDLAVFTDDDVLPHPDWLIRMRAAADTHPDYSIFGGVIRPRWEAPPPQWIQWINTQVAYAITDPAMVEGPTKPWFIFGGNMAIRAEVFKGDIRFNTSIGPRGKSYPMGSETELTLRLDRQGHKFWHVPDAVVEHFIGEPEMSKSWVLRRAMRYGRGSFRISQTPDVAGVPCFRGIPVNLFSRLFKKGVRSMIAWLSSNEQALLYNRWQFNYFLGNIIEAHVMRREKQRENGMDGKAH